MWGGGDYGVDQTPQRRPSMGGEPYDSTAVPRTAQRTMTSSYLFPSTPYSHGGRIDRTRSRDGPEDAYATPTPTPSRARYGDAAGGEITPGLFGMTPTAAGYTPFRRAPTEERPSALSTISTSPAERPGEQPPSRSLYDELEEEDVGRGPAPHTTDLMYTGSPGGEEYDAESGTWVTVFGFPPSQASYVLKLFQEIGEVVRHKTPLGQCNWMHIQFQTRTQARQALARNGKTFGGNLMVGVMECTDAAAQATGSSLSEFPRPLNAPVQSKLGHHEVDIFGTKVPKRSDSVWSKFMEYVVGA